MRKRGITLIELTVAITLGAILLLVLTVQFVANLKFQKVIGDKIAATQEAEIAIDHITQTLRFALSSPAPSNTDPSNQGYASPITASIQTVTIKAGNQYNASTAQIEYGLKNDPDNNNIPTLYYTPDVINDSAVTYKIATNITNFTATWNGADPTNINFTINITTQKNNETVILNTTIQTFRANP